MLRCTSLSVRRTVSSEKAACRPRGASSRSNHQHVLTGHHSLRTIEVCGPKATLFTRAVQCSAVQCTMHHSSNVLPLPHRPCPCQFRCMHGKHASMALAFLRCRVDHCDVGIAIDSPHLLVGTKRTYTGDLQRATHTHAHTHPCIAHKWNEAFTHMKKNVHSTCNACSEASTDCSIRKRGTS